MYWKSLKILLLSIALPWLLTPTLLSNNVQNHDLINSSHQIQQGLPYFLDIEINQVSSPEPVLSYVDADQHITIPLSILEDHQVKIEGMPVKDGYVAVHQVNWIQAKVDLKTQKLALTIPTDKFHEHSIDGRSDGSKASLDTSKSGSYLNYDVSGQNVHGQDMNMNGLNGFGELVYFNSKGFGSFSGVAYQNKYQKQITRLDTNWTYDQPDSQATWLFGDGISRTDDWGGSARFAGIQWATNYTFKPNFITFPTPSFKGSASVPSTLDIFVNDAMQMSKNIDHGPFVINDLPIVNGQGNVAVVTKDILGRRQEVVIPYYISQDLLKVGLKDYSFEIGALRHDYGTHSNRYGQGMMTGTYRQGLTDRWTLGGHSEITKQLQNIGLTNQYLLFNVGMLTSSVAVSRHSKRRNDQRRDAIFNSWFMSPDLKQQDAKRHGLLLSQSFNRQSDPFSFGAKVQATKGAFSEIGLYQTTRAPHITVQTFGSFATKNYGGVGVSYTERRSRKMADFRLMTLNYQKNIARNFNLNVYASRNLKQKSHFIGLTLMYVIDDRSSAMATLQKQAKSHSKSISYQASKVMDSKISYRLSAADTDGVYRQYETQVDVDQEKADYRLRASRIQNNNNLELNARGAVIYFDNKAFLSKYVHNSFGLAHVPNFPDISIYRSNCLVGKTDAEGYLLVPNLGGYQDNDIKIETTDLPLEAVIKTDKKYIKPARRAAAIARFEVTRSSMMIIRVLDEKGQDLKPGVVIYNQDKTKKYVVGLEGEVYIEQPLDQQKVVLDVQNNYNCRITIEASNQLLDNINTYRCKKNTKL